ncbi:phosphotransferase-like protein [Devosia sp.]|uniref:phosphotransferase-like protein n=1 Tax=Devosia sp. TaxID=1871048 RepID=UPI002B000562|nr:chloramphenicol phosphotransferase [Devosia sp.]
MTGRDPLSPPARPGRIVILNGAPRAGKSSLVRAVQRQVPGLWLNAGVDAMAGLLPEALRPGIGLRPGGERPDLEPMVAALYALLFETIAAQAKAGFDVVADLGMHSDYAAPFDPMDLLGARLGAFSPLLVGVLCGLDTIMARRNADPQGGFYAAGPGVPAPVRRWQEAVHRGKAYDLTLAMDEMTPEEGAERIAAALAARG